MGLHFQKEVARHAHAHTHTINIFAMQPYSFNAIFFLKKANSFSPTHAVLTQGAKQHTLRTRRCWQPPQTSQWDEWSTSEDHSVEEQKISSSSQMSVRNDHTSLPGWGEDLVCLFQRSAGALSAVITSRINMLGFPSCSDQTFPPFLQKSWHPQLSADRLPLLVWSEYNTGLITNWRYNICKVHIVKGPIKNTSTIFS